MTRHEFLAALHDLLKPKTYLEIGVQHGTSLNLAVHSEAAIGIDPHPLVTPLQSPEWNQIIFKMTSDQFFAPPSPTELSINLAFIDGMHLFEYALRDFMNVSKHMAPGGLIVFDDVLPRNQEEAAREQCPGDWTGDVWKVYYILRTGAFGVGSLVWLVDTQPTGLLLVRPNVGGAALARLIETYGPGGYDTAVAEFSPEYMDRVPEAVLNRTYALDPQEALKWVRDGMD